MTLHLTGQRTGVRGRPVTQILRKIRGVSKPAPIQTLSKQYEVEASSCRGSRIAEESQQLLQTRCDLDGIGMALVKLHFRQTVLVKEQATG